MGIFPINSLVMEEKRMKHANTTDSLSGKSLCVAVLAVFLIGVLQHPLHAQGFNIPAKKWGIGFGNSREFTGIRFNYRDSRVRRITGVNVTLWQPKEDNKHSVINGLSLGLIPGGGDMNGIQVGVFGVAGMNDIKGISLGILGVGCGNDLSGINIGGLGIGSGGDVWGLNIGGLGVGAGGDLKGINLGGLGVGAGGNVSGFSFGVMGIGAGENLSGINIGGLGAGAGANMAGLNVGILGIGAGAKLSGINIAGIGAGAGQKLSGITFCGIGAGSPKVRGFTCAGGAVGGLDVRGVAIALGTVMVRGEDRWDEGVFGGLALSAFNYIRGTQKGVAIGIVNYAYKLKGIQIGLINIVRDNPKAMRVLPVINVRF